MPPIRTETTSPIFLSPASPAELLSHIVNNCVYPTTLIICFSRDDFLSGLAHELSPGSELLAAPLYQVAVARHIRIVFIPTVSHLRAFLSVFPATHTTVRPPPLQAAAAAASTSHTAQGPQHDGDKSSGPPLLITYGFLQLHADTSEWSAQGLSNTAATLVETATQAGFRAVVVEPNTPRGSEDDGEAEAEGEGESKHDDDTASILAQHVPILSNSDAQKLGPGLAETGWTRRTVHVRGVLGRWFRFEDSHGEQERFW